MSRKPGEPFIDWTLGRVALRLLRLVGERARQRGDMHEAAHCNAAILAGNSHHEPPFEKCTLPFTSAAMAAYRKAHISGD